MHVEESEEGGTFPLRGWRRLHSVDQLQTWEVGGRERGANCKEIL
jgi:hypothetical protein